jgi:hypothetical protein
MAHRPVRRNVLSWPKGTSLRWNESSPIIDACPPDCDNHITALPRHRSSPPTSLIEIWS